MADNAAAAAMIRDPAALTRDRFDLLVIGGGIYGAWCAYDAAQRGLKVALIERGDWACGTSSASSKLIHGGLRYLEHFEFSLVSHALTERRVLARIAPHLVRPMNFVLPVWRGARVGSFRLSCGLMLYDLLAWRRQPVQRHKHYRKDRLLQRYPFLKTKGLNGGFRYGDCQEDDARVTLTVVRAAQQAGASVVNHCAATELLDGGAHLQDRLSGESLTISARHTVLTAGPWSHELLGEAAPAMNRVKGSHLVLPEIPDCRSAFLLTAPQDGRVFFVIPWYGRTLVGTTEASITDPDTAEVTTQETRYLLDAVAEWMPDLGWTENHVISRFAGTRALQAQDKANLAAVTREFAILQPRRGVTLPIGGKFTTARRDASEIIDRVARALGVHRAGQTAKAPLPGAPQGEFLQFLERTDRGLREAGADEAVAQHLALRYGDNCTTLAQMMRTEPELAERIHPSLPFVLAEAVYAVRDEMACTLDDVCRRRLPLDLLLAEGPWRQHLGRQLAEREGLTVLAPTENTPC